MKPHTHAYLHAVLTAIALLLAANLFVALGDRAPSLEPAAYADGDSGLPNAAAQRQQTVDLLKQLNQKVEALNSLFQSGRARVQVDGKAQ